jgi:hypothetical protein
LYSHVLTNSTDDDNKASPDDTQKHDESDGIHEYYSDSTDDTDLGSDTDSELEYFSDSDHDETCCCEDCTDINDNHTEPETIDLFGTNLEYNEEIRIYTSQVLSNTDNDDQKDQLYENGPCIFDSITGKIINIIQWIILTLLYLSHYDLCGFH